MTLLGFGVPGACRSTQRRGESSSSEVSPEDPDYLETKTLLLRAQARSSGDCEALIKELQLHSENGDDRSTFELCTDFGIAQTLERCRTSCNYHGQGRPDN